jgi:SAM-dependent methyltransferase
MFPGVTELGWPASPLPRRHRAVRRGGARAQLKHLQSPAVDADTLRQRRDQLAREHGPWHDSVPLGDGLTTNDAAPAGDDLRLASIVQAAVDALGGPLAGCRVLDLGAAEGRFAVELARRGARVVALEGRRGNVAKARFVKEALGLDDLEIVHDDVRSLSPERHGVFDLVLCLGILYHLDGQAAVELVHRLAGVTRRAAIVDTHVALSGSVNVGARGQTYRGRRVREFDPGASEGEQERLSRSSIGNPESVWLTRASLLNLLADAGFSSVADVVVPRHEKPSDRATLLAFRGKRLAGAPPRWPERERLAPHPNQTWRGAVKLRLAPFAPAGLKEWARRRRDRARRTGGR